ncbi:hypothetical protein CYMTET_50464 [Cymbomonas tetramitiformis]|uniref:Uncharacterized protein n=1 Tax=Cymbomonas tetramitiformis TaxID=36881 RepID=A0AAE0EUR0_9CHLO|nr:hypothetical protein CYMTET_50464 [Cymbomonas tetramitiformis]
MNLHFSECDPLTLDLDRLGASPSTPCTTSFQASNNGSCEKSQGQSGHLQGSQGWSPRWHDLTTLPVARAAGGLAILSALSVVLHSGANRRQKSRRLRACRKPRVIEIPAPPPPPAPPVAPSKNNALGILRLPKFRGGLVLE